MSTQYPADTQGGSLPSYVQQTAPGSGVWPDGGYKSSYVETFDSFFGYAGPISTTTVANQTIKPAPLGIDLGSANAPVYAIVGGVAQLVPQTGDPNL